VTPPLVRPEESREVFLTRLSAPYGYYGPTIEIAERLCPVPNGREAIYREPKRPLSTLHLLRGIAIPAPKFREQM
jgi:hypothetical protein